MNFPVGLGNKPKSTAGYKAEAVGVEPAKAETSESDLDQLPAVNLKAQLPPAIMQGGFGVDKQMSAGGRVHEQPVANLAVSGFESMVE